MEAGYLGCLRQLDRPHGHGTVRDNVSAESALLTDRAGITRPIRKDIMYDLLDDIESAISHLEDARDDLKYFSDEQCDVNDVLMTLREKRSELQKAISEFENKEKAALEREYYKNLL